jgi:CRISPR-associated protein Cst2
MNLWSISFAYRLGLGFHALNNEGADGSNLMQPRRIDVGNVTYDGISGEIIRRHILEHFVNICREQRIPMLPLSEALHPDRGPIGIRAAAKTLGHGSLTNDVLFPSVRKAIELCAVLDAGGYLAAWKEQDGGGAKKEYVAEKAYIESQCAEYKDAEPVKRESCFDVAWLISETPQDLTVTQHSAFRDTFAMNSRYAQTMRSNIYGGVIRADLHRIGMDDYWYLHPKGNGKDVERLAINLPERTKRQVALVRAIANFIASPTGAKVAGWAPHIFVTEGAILLTSGRTAPFVSPIKVCLNDGTQPVQENPAFSQSMKSLADEQTTWAWSFKNTKELLEAAEKAIGLLEGVHGDKEQKEKAKATGS